MNENMNGIMIQELSQKIADEVAKNILCNQTYGVLESMQGDTPLHLDNCTGNAQEANAMEGELAMAKHRMRICIGYNDDGSSIIKQISGNSEVDLADKIVRSILVSERRTEFITDAPACEKQRVPTFKEYTEGWLNTYKSMKLKPTTRKGYDAMLRSHFYPAWENTPIHEIDTKAIQEFLNERRNLSAKYLRDMRILIHVRRNVTFTNNQPIIGTPKTKSGFRSVPIMEILLKYLLPLKESGFIIGDDEQPLTLTGFRNMYRGISKKVDLHKATTHSFRHTLGTMMFNIGADIKTIQGVLGQKDFKTTADRYVHPVEKSKIEAIFKVNDMLLNPVL